MCDAQTAGFQRLEETKGLGLHGRAGNMALGSFRGVQDRKNTKLPITVETGMHRIFHVELLLAQLTGKFYTLRVLLLFLLASPLRSLT